MNNTITGNVTPSSESGQTIGSLVADSNQFGSDYPRRFSDICFKNAGSTLISIALTDDEDTAPGAKRYVKLAAGEIQPFENVNLGSAWIKTDDGGGTNLLEWHGTPE